jgi:hypothetical protein
MVYNILSDPAVSSCGLVWWHVSWLVSALKEGTDLVHPLYGCKVVNELQKKQKRTVHIFADSIFQKLCWIQYKSYSEKTRHLYLYCFFTTTTTNHTTTGPKELLANITETFGF